MFLGEFSFGNSVLGSCAVGLFVPDFDWKFSLGIEPIVWGQAFYP